MENTFTIDYGEKILTLNYQGSHYLWDLTEGDKGDFWHSFTHNNEVFDINLYQEDAKSTPSLSIYRVKAQAGELVTDTDSHQNAVLSKTFGNSEDYLGSDEPRPIHNN